MKPNALHHVLFVLAASDSNWLSVIHSIWSFGREDSLLVLPLTLALSKENKHEIEIYGNQTEHRVLSWALGRRFLL